MKRILSVLALVLAIASVAAPVRAAAAESDQAKLTVAREMIAAWKAAEWRKAADLFTEDGVLRSMMLEPVKGRAAIYDRIAALGKGAPGGVVLDVAHMGVIDGLVYMERVDRFTYNGKPGSVPVVGVLDIKDGKVREWREYYDRASLMHALGEK